jgi:hypothetical protein
LGFIISCLYEDSSLSPRSSHFLKYVTLELIKIGTCV